MSTWLERLTKPSPTNEPPAAGEMRRNDLLVAGVVLFALFLAFGIRNQVLNASQSVRLGEDLPRIAYPQRWREQGAEGALLRAVNAGSPSTYDSRVTVVGRPLRADELLEDARADRGIKLLSDLQGYRELSAERMTVYGDQPALVTNYAFIADPTRDLGAIGLPVVVEAQDIMFLHDGQFMVVTLEADAAEWDSEEPGFDIIRNSLRLQPIDEDADIISAPPTAEATDAEATGAAPVATPGAAGEEAAPEAADQSSDETGSFGSNSGGQSGETEGGN
jgi:hypothetical protein